MRLFWIRTKTDEAADSSWLLPFGDMMSLLLAVFVMIAAMSEFRRDDRFDRIGSAVRSGFGFSAIERSSGTTALSDRASTFVERLQKAGLISSGLRVPEPIDPELAACCKVTTGPDRIVVQVGGDVAFERFRAQLMPEARQLLGRIGEALANGQTRLEIRAYAGDGQLPPQAGFGDAMDLSFARARAVTNLLIGSGIASDRISVTTCGDQKSPSTEVGQSDQAWGRRIEMIVHTREPGVHALNIAEKERAENG